MRSDKRNITKNECNRTRVTISQFNLTLLCNIILFSALSAAWLFGFFFCPFFFNPNPCLVPLATLECLYLVIYLLAYFLLCIIVYLSLVWVFTGFWLDIGSVFEDIWMVFLHLKAEIIFFSNPILVLSWALAHLSSSNSNNSATIHKYPFRFVIK